MDEATTMRERGEQVLRDIGWGHMTDRPVGQYADLEFWDHTVENLFGRMFGRPGLTVREREMIVMAIVIAQDSDMGIANHFRNCHAAGITEREVREIIFTAMYYAGWPKGSAAIQRFNKILQEPNSTWPPEMRLAVPLEMGVEPDCEP